MKKILLSAVAFSALFLTSCGGGGWPEEAKQQMLDGCKQGASEEACSCYIEKVTTKYTPEDIQKDENAVSDMMDMMKECMGAE